MKFYVEQYSRYYPSGGLDDLKGPFDTMEQAMLTANTEHDFVTIIKVENDVLSKAARWSLSEKRWKREDDITIEST